VTGVGERGALEMQCKCAKVERWARAKLASGLVVGWASGMGGRGRGRRQCEGAKVNVSGLVGEWTSGLGREDAVPLKLD